MSELDGVVPAEEPVKRRRRAMRAPLTKQGLLDEATNTSTIAALVGGFAWGGLNAPEEDSDDYSTSLAIYLCSFVAIHACTCSALSSAFIFQVVNTLDDDDVPAWATKYKMIMFMPMAKFIIGSFMYMAGVILISWRDLSHHSVNDDNHSNGGWGIPWQAITGSIGALSMGSVVVTAFVLLRSVSARQGMSAVYEDGGRITMTEEEMAKADAN